MTTRATLIALLLVASGCRAPRPADPTELRVLTYNLHHGEGLDGRVDLARLAGVIRDARPDLVALQEVDRGVARTAGVDQLAELARLTGLEPAFARFMDYQGGAYGLAILSRFELTEARAVELPPGELEPRSALVVRVVAPGVGPLVFACAHLDWLDDDARRLAQAERLAAELRAVAGPVILAGDLNDVPGSRTLARLERDLEPARKPADRAATFPAPAPERELDHVLFAPRDAFRSEARVLDERVASDHRPVLAVLRPVDD